MRNILVISFIIFGMVACTTMQSRQSSLESPKALEARYLKGQSVVIVAPIASKHFGDESKAVDKWNQVAGSSGEPSKST
jgi:hypothetical protein